jgi:hypothetical protein
MAKEPKTTKTPKEKDPQSELPHDMRATFVEPSKHERTLPEWNCFEDDAIELHLYLTWAQTIGNRKPKKQAEASIMRYLLEKSIRKGTEFQKWKTTDEGAKALHAVKKELKIGEPTQH